MTCPNCRRVLPDTTPAEIIVLRAENARLVAQSARDVVAHGTLRDLIMSCKREIAALTPTWRDGDPPAGVCWREGVRLPVEVMIHHDGDVWWYRSSSDIGDAWGTARWCPIARPS